MNGFCHDSQIALKKYDSEDKFTEIPEKEKTLLLLYNVIIYLMLKYVYGKTFWFFHHEFHEMHL